MQEPFAQTHRKLVNKLRLNCGSDALEIQDSKTGTIYTELLQSNNELTWTEAEYSEKRRVNWTDIKQNLKFNKYDQCVSQSSY
jgi:hypothetical protein